LAGKNTPHIDMLDSTMNDDDMSDHLANPYHRGRLDNATHRISQRNPACGDEVTLELRIEGNSVKEAWHNAKGCGLCKATTSAICQNIEGMLISDVLQLPELWSLHLFGFTISPGRRDCCFLPMQALRALLANHANLPESQSE
jgi:nitrogen fixation NifU-like protein